MRARNAVLSGLATLAVVGAAVGSRADAAPEVPWGQRPVTVGSGFALASTPSQDVFDPAPAVTASGRWVVFATRAALDPNDIDGEPDVYLRDRWTDLTRLLPGEGFILNLAVSAGGSYAVSSREVRDPELGPQVAHRFYNTSTGRTTEVVGPYAERFRSVNDDGYFLVVRVENGGALMRSGRVHPDGTVTPPVPTAFAQDSFLAVSNSMQRALSFVSSGRPEHADHQYALVDLVAGTEQAIPTEIFADLPADRTGIVGAAFSPNERLVAVLTDYGDTRGFLRLWDTTTGVVQSRLLTYGDYDRPVLAGLLDDGRVVYQLRDEVKVWDPAKGLAGDEIVSTTYAGDPVPATRLVASQLIATDIGRVIVCSQYALSPYDTNGVRDCYLRALPPR